MPDCHRCERNFPTAELRRTPKGYVCKNTIACKRRLGETKSYALSSTFADRLALHVRSFDEQADEGRDPLALLRLLAIIKNDLVTCAEDIVYRAARETNLTQKQLAEALDVPSSTLAGLKQSVK
jgi:hypothetical protein